MSDINIIEPRFIPIKSPIAARLDGSDLIDERPQKINFLGKRLNSIADINIDSKNKKININIAEKAFSSDYIPEEYIYIAVWDTKGKMVFQKKLSDAEIKEEKIELPFEVGYQLEMYHPIPSRLVSSPDLYSIIDSNSSFTLLVMTPLGVTNPKMESYPTDIIEADFIHPNSVSVGVNADVVEPASTAEPTTSTPIAPDTPSASTDPIVSTSTRTGIDSTTKLMVSFQFKLLGVCDYDIATVTIDEESKLAGIKIVTDTPHCHFGDELYASIKVTDKQGHITFEEKLYGTNANISNTIIPFEKGYKLDIFHAEPSRLRVSSGDSDTLIPESKQNSFIMTSIGIENTRQGSAEAIISDQFDTEKLVQDMSSFGDSSIAPVDNVYGYMGEKNHYQNVVSHVE
ncbi:viral enhancin family protein [Yersinia pseudotuberculosis]|uniref:Putative mucin/carbohydrate-binding domain-containing protein n=1 Tax=Yersinia pseudotuberculosis serotype O:3 (strain YPIII) TaxID=502800 RepID=A0A0H3B8Z7_YERPY|nr:putative mucin/carbohydrate-binding domain-containing protein [Yersinia pseudotuberculosis]AJJ60160.1 viral enhancin family protein [Yersinia pseudotuberculosis YPIII]AYW85915.1 viral enhancin family protein [Yersinia pseudotuberculosis]AYX00554.1 viral enhancin family protein [Yersinia pseudotuberculosis]AZA32119.1 viral enhancin family protein [Yersinia pseudotuberculosis]MBK1423012.1 viral enhancin family protein [Yersinia pseudotuberculosis]